MKWMVALGFRWEGCISMGSPHFDGMSPLGASSVLSIDVFSRFHERNTYKDL